MADTIALNPFEQIKQTATEHWKCRAVGCREPASKSARNLLEHFFSVHLEEECPTEYTVYWCQYCHFNATQKTNVARHQDRYHKRLQFNAEHPDTFLGCLDCKIAWPHFDKAVQEKHQQDCPVKIADNTSFRRWNRYTFRFDYTDNPIARDMLCAPALEVEPTMPTEDVELVKQLQATLDELSEDDGTRPALVRRLEAIRLRRDLMVRAHAIVRDEERLRMVEDDLHNLRTQQDLQLGRLSIDAAHFRPMPHGERLRATPEAGHSAAHSHSLSRSSRLVSPRQRAIYFSP